MRPHAQGLGQGRLEGEERARPRARWRVGAWVVLYGLLAGSPLALMLVGRGPSSRGFVAELAAALGYLALALLSLQLVLGARPRWVVNRLGVDTFLLFHRAGGQWAAVFVFLHLGLLAVVKPGFVLHLLAPQASPPHGIVLWCALLSLVLMVVVPRQLTRLRISYEVWRVAHALLGLGILVIALWHVLVVGRSIESSAERTMLGVWVGAAAVWLLGARVLRPWLVLRRPWRLVEVKVEQSGVWTLVFEALGHEGMAFRPGQSVWLTLDRSPFSPRQHPLTIASSALSPRRVSLTIKALGDFTRTVGDTKVGTRAFLTGPYGSFALDVQDPRPLLLVAGGIGITPMMSMLRTLRDRGDRRPVLLLYGIRSLDERVFAEELEALARSGGVRVVVVVEHPPLGWTGERGVIGGALLARCLQGALADAEVFVCGPEPMMNLVERSLQALGVRGERVHTEHFALVGSRPPGGRSSRERHVGALFAVLAGLWVCAALGVAMVRIGRV